MKDKISIIPFLISILTIITITIGTSYSLWTTSVQQESTNEVDVGCFKIVFDDTNISGGGNINIENAYPISNEKGMSLTPYKFSISNECSVAANYSVNLETLLSSTMDENVLDVYFDEGDIRHYFGNVDNDEAKSTMFLYKGYLGVGESAIHSLRLWIDYDVTVNTPNVQGASWNGRIVVNSEATFAKPVFTNKVIDSNNVTLDIQTNSDKEIKSIKCYYGDKNKQADLGTAIDTTSCQFPINAEYAKYEVTYSDNSIDTSVVKHLADYFIKDGKMIKKYSVSSNATVTMEDGYINMIVDNGGRGGLRTNDTYDFTKYGYTFAEISYTSIKDSIYPSFSLAIAANGGSTIDKNDSDGSFSINLTKSGTANVNKSVFSRAMSLDNTYNSTTLEILRNHSGNSVLNANIYNVWFQLKD